MNFLPQAFSFSPKTKKLFQFLVRYSVEHGFYGALAVLTYAITFHEIMLQEIKVYDGGMCMCDYSPDRSRIKSETAKLNK